VAALLPALAIVADPVRVAARSVSIAAPLELAEAELIGTPALRLLVVLAAFLWARYAAAGAPNEQVQARLLPLAVQLAALGILHVHPLAAALLVFEIVIALEADFRLASSTYVVRN